MGVIALGALAALTVGFGQEVGSDRLYGRVHTTDGEVVEGFLRWDRNETGRTDFLDASRELSPEHLREAERLDPEYAAAQRRARSLVAFGMRLTWEEDDEVGPPRVPTALRFGHIASITIVDFRTAAVRLRSGEEVTLGASSSDLGVAMRELVVERPAASPRTFAWRDLDRVEFSTAPPGAGPPTAARIHGTVTTWDGAELTGLVTWDRDEALTDDVLDGRERGEDHEIAFGDIAAIEWESDRSARVTLRSGVVLVLRGTNDVDRRNRGIEVTDPLFGRAIVPWSAFRSVRFTSEEPVHAWPDITPGAPIRGTVYAVDGRVIEGEIRWGHEETQAWEMLDGFADDVEMDIEFGAIAAIVKNGDEGVTVTLRDGRRFHLEGTDDVGEGHAGVFVKPVDRPRRLVRWRDLDRIELSW